MSVISWRAYDLTLKQDSTREEWMFFRHDGTLLLITPDLEFGKTCVQNYLSDDKIGNREILIVRAEITTTHKALEQREEIL